MSPATIDFAIQHRLDDPARLLLGKAPDGVDLKAAAQQIEGWQTARTKWPRLAANPLVMYPPRLNREQASSEATAAYKAHIISTLHSPLSTLRAADLTAGMGVDAMAFAAVADSVDAFELDPDLCDLLAYNAKTHGISNLHVHNANSIDTILGQSTAPASPLYDIIYIDPARRDAAGRRVAAFEDCTPDILAAMPALRASCRWLLVKASPMVDITQALRQLPAVSELHIVALNGECKELLFLVDFSRPAPDTEVHCVNLQSPCPTGRDLVDLVEAIGAPQGEKLQDPQDLASAQREQETISRFSYRLSDTAPAPCLADSRPRYLLVPDATIMKAACHSLVAQRFGLQLLTRGGHIFAADAPVDGFPGRIFRVDAEVQLDHRSLQPLLPDWRASIISRGHPLAADAIRRRLRLADAPADAPFIIATAFASRPVAYLCSRLA